MSPKICMVSFMEPIQTPRTGIGRSRYDLGDGLTEARDPKRLLGLSHAFQQGKTLRLELRNGNFFHDHGTIDH